MAEEQVCSPSMRKYFQEIETEVTRSYNLANKARALNLDPEDHVDIIRTQNMAERVAGLISIVAPQLLHTNLAERIPELEKEYGKLDWRVGFKVAEEVAKESFCKFSSKEEAMEVAIRVGFAYLTLGIVSAPLEGFVCLKIKKRLDNGQPYFSLNYAGPVRGAGGTAAATSVLLSDYVRVKMGYVEYDPTEEEVKRFATEIHDYHERVTNLQYHPSTEEIEFLARHVPVEINGDPTEKFEVSQHKDIPRIETNRIRGGVCLVMAEGIAQKAPKLWKRLSVWGKEMGLNWEFLAEFLELQKQIKAKREVKKEAKSEEKLTPNFTFIKDLVAGRPILTYPMREGGFRLRYGRSRLSGFSALGLNPATMQILDKFIAIGTQLKIERPGKAGVVSLCDTIDGPIVKLKNGSVVYLATPAEAKLVNDSVEEILFLGDILFNYGDFSENGHKLIPAGYCPEWWIQEVEKAAKEKFSEETWFNLSSQIGIAENRLKELNENFFTVFPSVEESGKLSSFLNVPLHPAYTYHWRRLSLERLKQLFVWLKQATFEYQDDQYQAIKKIILPWKKEEWAAAKESLELIGMPHKVSIEFIVLENEAAQTISLLFNFKTIVELETIVFSETAANALEAINAISSIKMRDKSGTFIGARMGRPEKAKMRKMDGSPQALFPVGEEGDRMRSFQAALAAGKVTADFPLLYCQKCKKNTVYLRCEICGEKPLQKYHCKFCGDLSKEQCQHGPARNFGKTTIDIKHYFDLAMKQTEIKMAPDLIKGVRGTSNKNHFVENLAKGLLRAKHNLYVNKDGTIRYDCTEMPITHFKPIEVNTSVEKLKGLGYEKDIYDKPLETADQILELKPQDVILPGFNSLDESAIQVMFRTAKFVDELLVKIYHQPSFYNLKNEGDLIGHLVIGLAPHISAGLMGRIIGFSETQGLLAHPLWHAGLRRDCFDKNTYFPFYDGQTWEIKKIGEVVEKLNPLKVVDDYETKEIIVQGIRTVGINKKITEVHNFTKHTPQPMVKITTKLGRTLKITANHKQIIYKEKKFKTVLARQMRIGDLVAIPYNLKIPKKDCTEINLFHYLVDQDWVMVRGVNQVCREAKEYAKKYFSKRDYNNYTSRDSYPIKFINDMYRQKILNNISSLRLAAKRDTVTVPSAVPLTKEFFQLIGLYIAEGYSREVPGRLYQVYIAAENPEIREFVQKNMFSLFGLKITENKGDRLTYSSRILYYLITSILKCGSSAYKKRIPPQFLNLPNKKLGHLLSGYLEGDGSVSHNNLRVTFDTVSEGLLRDIDFVFGQMGIFVKNYTYTSPPGPKVRSFYIKKGKPIPSFTITKGIIQSIFIKKFSKYINFISSRKRNIFSQLIASHKAISIASSYTSELMFDPIVSVEYLPEEESYCLNVEGNLVIANSLLTKQCDGDEAAILMLMDGLLNFSRQFLPDQRGGRSVTADTLVYIRREGKISSVEIGNLILELFSRYGFVNEEGYRILRDCPEKIETLSFDTQGRVNFSPVSAFISHPNDRQIFRIKTTNGEIRVTEDHSIFITRGKDIRPIPARELLPGQAIVGLHSLRLEQEQLSEIDVLKLLDPSLAYITPDKMFLKKIKTKPLAKGIFQLFGKNNPYRYLSGIRAAPYAFYQYLAVEPEGKIRLKADSAEIKRKIPLNERFYKLLGFILAEGAVSSQQIELTNTSKEIMDEMAEICNRLVGYNPPLRIDRRSEKYTSGQCFKLSLPRIFALSLIAYGLNTNKAKQKEIPPFVFEASPEKIKAFLEGYLVGDGSVRKGCNLLYTSSPKLAAGLSLLLSLAGYKSGLHKTKTNKYQISYSSLNNTDPFWPLWEFAKELPTELRKNGVAQREIKLILTNMHKNKRMKTTSLEGIKNILSLLPSGEIKKRLQEIAAGHLKTERVVKVEQIDYVGEVYDFAVPGKENFLCGPHPIFAHNTMDAPLVLTSIINPSEVDDQAQGIDVVWKYPLEFYEAALQYKPTSEVKIAQIKHSIGKETQFEKMGFIHQTNNLNAGINCSSYKTIPEMMEKLRGQMELARRIRAVDTMDVANMVIQKHFLKDIRGNLRQFSQQQFRCTKCNTKYRRPPLLGRCSCGQNLLFTVTEGSIVKYLGPSMMLAKDYGLSDYLKQNLELTHRYVESIFGKEKDKQEGLVRWFG